jgi:MbtH protein
MPYEEDERPIPKDQQFFVVTNLEEQYSIWPVDRPLPLGWKATGFTGSREVCLDHISEVWTDMRPLSLRNQSKP